LWVASEVSPQRSGMASALHLRCGSGTGSHIRPNHRTYPRAEIRGWILVDGWISPRLMNARPSEAATLNVAGISNQGLHWGERLYTMRRSGGFKITRVMFEVHINERAFNTRGGGRGSNPRRTYYQTFMRTSPGIFPKLAATQQIKLFLRPGSTDRFRLDPGHSRIINGESNQRWRAARGGGPVAAAERCGEFGVGHLCGTGQVGRASQRGGRMANIIARNSSSKLIRGVYWRPVPSRAQGERNTARRIRRSAHGMRKHGRQTLVLTVESGGLSWGARSAPDLRRAGRKLCGSLWCAVDRHRCYRPKPPAPPMAMLSPAGKT
jgi:hypothetical protein